MQRICPICHVLFTPETRRQTTHNECKRPAKPSTKERGLTGLHRRVSERYKAEGAACVYCGSTEFITAGHIVARENGGQAEESNYQPECRACNARKKNPNGPA